MNQTLKHFALFLTIAGFLAAVPLNGHSQKVRKGRESNFSFIFLTDIHLQPERNAIAGFRQAIDTINSLKPDFVITGGDLIFDALGQKYSRADSLYKLYQETIKNFRMPVYNTMGNHEIYGIYEKSGANKANPEYGEKMFEKRLGKSYYSFVHKGWKFMVLNSVEDTKKSGYIGMIDTLQMNWIKEELRKTDSAMPIAISTHIPFIAAYTQKYEGSTKAHDSATVIVNAREVLALFNGHNLKLVLQGHLHTVEDIFIDGIHFITGGSVAAAWWKGPNMGYEEGFLKVNIKNNKIKWDYVDYGWKVPAGK